MPSLDAGAAFPGSRTPSPRSLGGLYPYTSGAVVGHLPSVTPIAVAARCASPGTSVRGRLSELGPLGEVDRRDATREVRLAGRAPRAPARWHLPARGCTTCSSLRSGRRNCPSLSIRSTPRRLAERSASATKPRRAERVDGAHLRRRATKLSFFDHFEHSRAGVLHALATDHPRRFGPRLVGVGDRAHAHFPTLASRGHEDAATGEACHLGAPGRRDLRSPAAGYLALFGWLAAIHAFTGPPSPTDLRRGWVWSCNSTRRGPSCADPLPTVERSETPPIRSATHRAPTTPSTSLDGGLEYAASAHP